MLHAADLARFAAEYQVSDAQILRDHLISHILAALPGLEIPELTWSDADETGRRIISASTPEFAQGYN
jgi:hypothetical protein